MSSYIGRGIDQIDNISTLDNLSFNGSDATFNLTQNSVAFVPVSADALQIQIDGILQSGNYTVSGSTVTFDFTPSGSSVCNGIKHFGVGVMTSVSDGAVTTAKLGADSVNATKIADDSISDEHLDITAITGQTAITSLADTDKFLVSDASDSGNLKYVENQYLGGGTHVLLDDTYISSSTATITYSSSLITDTYEQYIITGSAIQMGSNSNGNLFISLSDDNGSSYFTGSSDYARGLYVLQSGNSSNTIISRMGDQNGIYLSGANYDYGGGTAYGNMGFVIRFLNLRNLATGSSARRLSIMDSVYLDRSSGNYANDRGFHYFKGGTGSINNIKISVTDSNTIGEGEFRLYGVA